MNGFSAASFFTFSSNKDISFAPDVHFHEKKREKTLKYWHRLVFPFHFFLILSLNFWGEAEGGDYAPLTHFSKTPPAVLCPVLESSAQGRRGAVGTGQEEGHKDGIEHLSHEERMRELELFICGREGHRKTLENLPVPTEEKLFSRGYCKRIRGNGFKIREGQFKLHTRKKCFTIRVAKHWSSLSKKVADVSSLGTPKARFDGL